MWDNWQCVDYANCNAINSHVYTFCTKEKATVYKLILCQIISALPNIGISIMEEVPNR